MKEKILIADDESRMRKLLKDFLEKEGYKVTEAENGEKALEAFYDSENTDLLILDVMMPKIDGWEVLKEIRETGCDIPVIMLTAKGEEKDELKGFNLGADEYISKPFSPRILVARIGALLKRKRGSETDNTVEAGGICLDMQAHEVKIDGIHCDLSIKEYELLEYFMNNPGIALSRDRILSQVWDYDYYGDARTIDTHVKKLRNKLGDKGEYIKTVWGLGYKFEV